jgi:hypothetical protein
VLVPARALAVSRLFRLLIFDYFFKGLNKVRDTRTGSDQTRLETHVPDRALFVSACPCCTAHGLRPLASWQDKAVVVSTSFLGTSLLSREAALQLPRKISRFFIQS